MEPDSSPLADDSVRHRLYDVVYDSGLSLAEKQQQVLEVGRTHLAVETAHIQHQVDDETHEVVASVGESPVRIAEGTTLERATTYCRRTIEAHSPVAVTNAPEEGWESDPAYENLGWDCYLGATIFVDNGVYGTVCFISEQPRETEFSAEEKTFVELIARLLGRAIESHNYQQHIDQTAQDKQRAEETYEALLQLSPDAVIVADAETGLIETANGEAATLTGYTVEELRGKSVLELHPNETREQYAELLDEMHDHDIKEQFDDGTQLYIRHADGTDIPIELGISSVEIADRQLVLGIIRDITDRRRRECKLAQQNERLEQFVGVVSHDLRNPLNIAQGNSKLIAELIVDAKTGDGTYASLSDETMATLDSSAETLVRTHDRMETLIEDLLVLAQQDQPIDTRESISLATLAENCWEMVASHDATLVVDEDLIFNGDPDRLKQLFENLFRNSVEHGSTGSQPQADDSVEHGSTGSRTQSGDSVEHSSTSSQRENRADDSVEHGGDGVTISVGPLADGDGFYVADDGPGIPEAKREDVFESGFTTNRNGTGFGLHIVEEIAAAHGWELQLTDSHSGGARFEVSGIGGSTE